MRIADLYTYVLTIIGFVALFALGYLILLFASLIF